MPEDLPQLYLPPWPRQPPATLYHYTSRAGLLAITQNHRLWATNIRYFNDSSEFTAALSVALVVLDEMVEALTEADEREALLTARPWLEGMQHQGQSYVCSFSEEGDQLSQWRSYCRPGDGYALGLRSADLVTLARPQQYFLAPCEYDDRAQRALMAALLEESLRRFRANRHLTLPDPMINLRGLATFALLSFLYVAPLVKHAAFREEREWRLVCPLYGRVVSDVLYRAGKHAVIPYREFSLHRDGVALPYEEVVIGPSPHAVLDSVAVIDLLRSRGVHIAGCRWSPTPFRDW